MDHPVCKCCGKCFPLIFLCNNGPYLFLISCPLPCLLASVQSLTQWQFNDVCMTKYVFCTTLSLHNQSTTLRNVHRTSSAPCKNPEANRYFGKPATWLSYITRARSQRAIYWLPRSVSSSLAMVACNLEPFGEQKCVRTAL